MSETEEHERNLALAWYEGHYDQQQAEYSAEIQGLNFKNIKQYYGEYYHKYEAMSRER